MKGTYNKTIPDIKYTVVRIEEADFGCEERPDGAPLMINVYLKDTEGNKKCMEASDALLYKRGIDEGTCVTLHPDHGLLKVVHVVAAIICRGTGEGMQIFATQRGYGEFKDGWEFPGGKVEDGESSEEALKREINEELETVIEVGQLVDTVEFDYPGFHLSMDCFICKIIDGELKLLEHEAAKWLAKNELRSIDWLPADKGLIDKIENMFDYDIHKM